MEGADLRESKLREANLCKADLGKARLYGANLSHAQLDSADLRGALYDHKTLFPADFEMDKAGAHLIAPGSNLSDLDLSRSVMWGVNLQNAILEGGINVRRENEIPKGCINNHALEKR